jgi:uncharacterized protein YfaP (DUF2135 family)
MMFTSCSKDGSDDPVLTEEEKTLITADYKALGTEIGAIIQAGAAEEDIRTLISEATKYESVETAYVEGNMLGVKFKNGGRVYWEIYPEEDYMPPYIGELNALSIRSHTRAATNMPDNNKAVLINQQYLDEERLYCREIMTELDAMLEQSGYDVTSIDGTAANIDFFADNLDDYGVVYFITHGCYDSTDRITWLATGEETSWDELYLLFNHLAGWIDNRVSINTRKEKRDGKFRDVTYCLISDRFIDKEYDDDSFANSLWYVTACQGMMSPTLGQTLDRKGAGVTIGWDETNCIGKFTGIILFQGLLGGYSLEEAYAAIPEESVVDYCSVKEGARLVYYPTSGGTMYLVSTPETEASITFESPTPGQIIANRVATLTGSAQGFARVDKGTVEVNGIATTLTLTGTNTFAQPVELQMGQNHIKVTCYGTSPSGEPAYASATLTVTGDFPMLALYTQLRWNTNHTDVDFHLLPPGFTADALFTSTDCYFRNKSPWWGAMLDVDDVDGYGPEHITIPSTPEAGRYTLYVHYYSDHGNGQSDAYVSVAANNGRTASFGPYTLMDEDIVAVCTIDYPNGTITPINQKLSTRATRSLHVPAKGE